MKTSCKAIRWPNQLGWTIRVEHGEAEVRDLVSRLRVFVPVAPRMEWSERARKPIAYDRYKVCDVPLETDPLQAVRTCQASGLLCEVGDSTGAVPTVA